MTRFSLTWDDGSSVGSPPDGEDWRCPPEPRDPDREDTGDEIHEWERAGMCAYGQLYECVRCGAKTP